MIDPVRAWTWRHQILKSDLPSTTRLVLLTLSCFMNDVGEGAYPTQEQLARATGLTDRAVRKHLELAEEKGWIKRSEHGFRGQRWRNNEYWALWPDPLHVDEREERGSAAFSQRSGTSFRKVRNEVPTTSPVPSSSPLPPPAAPAGAPQDVVPGRNVHAVLEEALYAACCAVTSRNPALTDRTGGWYFTEDIIARAQARLKDRMP